MQVRVWRGLAACDGQATNFPAGGPSFVRCQNRWVLTLSGHPQSDWRYLICRPTCVEQGSGAAQA